MVGMGRFVKNLFTFILFALRPTTRTPDLFDFADIGRAVAAFGGLSIFGILGKLLDDRIQSSEAEPMTPDFMFTIVFPLAFFVILAVFAGARLQGRLREAFEPRLRLSFDSTDPPFVQEERMTDGQERNVLVRR